MTIKSSLKPQLMVWSLQLYNSTTERNKDLKFIEIINDIDWFKTFYRDNFFCPNPNDSLVNSQAA